MLNERTVGILFIKFCRDPRPVVQTQCSTYWIFGADYLIRLFRLFVFRLKTFRLSPNTEHAKKSQETVGEFPHSAAPALLGIVKSKNRSDALRLKQICSHSANV